MEAQNHNSSKAHLVYMTGLSVNKMRMNNIVELINFDKDFTYWRKDCIKDYDEITSGMNFVLRKLNKITNKQISTLIEAVTSVGDAVNIFDNETLENFSDANADNFFQKIRDRIASVPKTIINQAFKKLGYLDSDEAYSIDKELAKKFFAQSNLSIETFLNGDFFSLYLSNQSDSIGVLPLAKLSPEKNFNLHHTYCDWDYYDNKFVDSVILKVDRENFSSYGSIEKDIENIFKSHIRELMFARAIWQNYLEKEEIEKEEDTTQNHNESYISVFELLSGEGKYNQKSILQMFGDRNFFGVSLLSKILYYLENNQIQPNDIENSSSDKQLTINILDEGALGEFCKELIEYSANPETLKFSNENSLVELRIYTSDGRKLEKEISVLEQDSFFSKMFLDLNENKNSEQRKNLIKNKYQYTVDASSSSIDTNLRYIATDSDSFYIKVPIKIMLSLPLDTKEIDGGLKQVPSQKLYIPKCIDNEEKNELDIITVGGAEHNRALAHLINKHRFETKGNMLFGFMDNYYDMTYKINKETQENNDYMEYSFFMGLNQPVSGWNYVLNARLDSNDGSSINSDVKYLHFKLKDGNRVYRIVSIYGFSAIASVLGINLFIAEQMNKDNIEFKGKFSEFFSKNKLIKSLDTASAIYFESNPKGTIFKELKKCYQYAFNYDIDKFVELLKNNNSIFIKENYYGRLSSKNAAYQENR